jgi:hypothetical protein
MENKQCVPFTFLRYMSLSEILLWLFYMRDVTTVNQDDKLENFKGEMQKNAGSVLGVSDVRWKRQGEIRSVTVGSIIPEERAKVA